MVRKFQPVGGKYGYEAAEKRKKEKDEAQERVRKQREEEEYTRKV